MGSIKFNLFDFLGNKIKNADVVVSKEEIETLAYKELALYIAISYIANTLSKCEIKVFEKNKEVKNKLYYMLNYSPNPNENSSQFMNKLIESYYYDGQALIVPQNNNIYIADHFYLSEDYPLNEFMFDNITFGRSKLQNQMKSSDVFYFKLDDKQAKKLVDSVYNTYGQIISRAINYYKTSNSTKFLFKNDRYKTGDDEFNKKLKDNLNKKLVEFIKADTSVFPIYEGEDFKSANDKAAKDTSDIISIRKEIFETTAQAFKIPNSMMLGNITNINDIVNVFLSLCIDPLADMISEELTRKYFTYTGWKAGSYFKVDTSCIKHTDIFEVADKIFNLVGSGAFNIDDVRERCGYDSLNTDFSKQFFVSKNFDTAENALHNPGKGGE